MKLVYCILDHTPAGGTERALSIQANYFAEKGEEVHIVTTEKTENNAFYSFSSEIRIHNLDINYREVDNAFSLSSVISRIRKGRVHKKKLSELLFSIKADFVFTMYGHEMSFLYKIKDGSKKIIEFHFSKDYRSIHNKYFGRGLFKSGFALFKEWRKRLFINRYDSFVVLTNGDAKKWGNLKNIVVIPNAVSINAVTETVPEAKRVICVARLSAEKGLNYLIDAWKTVSEKHPDWILDIFGTGDMKADLISRIKSMGLEKSCFINAPVKNIFEEYRKSSIFVLSSLYEGFGLVLIEAMSCSLPCVSFSCPYGPEEIITNGSDGYLVPVMDVNGLADRICNLIEDDELRTFMSRNAYCKSQKYSIVEVMKKWENLLGSIKDENNNRKQVLL